MATLLPGLSAPASTAPPGDSLYQLHAILVTSSGARQPLDLYRGHPTLVSMFYGSCPAACPMLITSLQVYERQLGPAARARLRVLLVSFDGSRDTPQQLKAFARDHHTDPAHWTVASASAADTRRIATLLAVQYRQLPDGQYDHSLLVTLLDEEGRILASTARLLDDPQFRAHVQAATAPADNVFPDGVPSHDIAHR